MFSKTPPVPDAPSVERANSPRHIRTIIVDVNIPGTTEWHTVTGWDAPWIMRPNPEKGVLRIYSGDEPEESIATLTESRIDLLTEAGRTREWAFGMGQWRAAWFGEMRP